MHRLIDYADAMGKAAYGFLTASVGTGAATWKFAPQMQFLNENAPALGLGMSFIFGVAGICLGVANVRINARRSQKK